MIVIQIGKKEIPDCYETRRFITVVTKACHSILSWCIRVQSTLSDPPSKDLTFSWFHYFRHWDHSWISHLIVKVSHQTTIKPTKQETKYESTLWSEFILQKLTVALLRWFPAFMDPECSLPCSEDLLLNSVLSRINSLSQQEYWHV
jgi:hypothetical protein